MNPTGETDMQRRADPFADTTSPVPRKSEEPSSTKTNENSQHPETDTPTEGLPRPQPLPLPLPLPNSESSSSSSTEATFAQRFAEAEIYINELSEWINREQDQQRRERDQQRADRDAVEEAAQLYRERFERARGFGDDDDYYDDNGFDTHFDLDMPGPVTTLTIPLPLAVGMKSKLDVARPVVARTSSLLWSAETRAELDARRWRDIHDRRARGTLSSPPLLARRGDSPPDINSLNRGSVADLLAGNRACGVIARPFWSVDVGAGGGGGVGDREIESGSESESGSENESEGEIENESEGEIESEGESESDGDGNNESESESHQRESKWPFCESRLSCSGNE